MTGVTPSIAAAREAVKAASSEPFTIGREFRVLGHIPRWSIIRTIRQQNVAEHTTMVMFLVDRFCAWLGERDAIGLFEAYMIEPVDIIRMALYHDMSEILSGDIANPAKQAMFRTPGAKDGYKAWEADRLKDRFPWYVEPTNSFGRDVVGLCDLLEADMFLLEEARMGNTEVNAIGTEIAFTLRDMSNKFSIKYGVDPMPFIRSAKDEIIHVCDRVVK